MIRQDLIDFCLTFSAAYEDYPFDEPMETATAVMRHRGNRKSFALIMRHNGKLYLNLKCDPFEADFLRQAFKAVIPGWHMNKQHWNTVVCDEDCDVPEEEIKRMVGNSYDLIKPKQNPKGGQTKMNKGLTPKNHAEYGEIISIIERARENAFRAVNHEVISMYWEIGAYVSDKVKNGGWGKAIVKEFSEFIQSHFAGIQGFSTSNIWRMRQFYETYKDNERLVDLTREINWSNNLKIMARAKTEEAREFYLLLAAKNRYSRSELERQIDSMLFERTMISDEKNKLFITKSAGLAALRDNYVLEFLDIPHNHKERELRKAILGNLKNFILEFGKDFSFVGEEYRVQVGNSDFKIDLLFFNRELACLVAIELKVGAFKPEHLGQLEFYLEALDSDVKKENENPSVGLILCADKDDAVVEYALRRSISPALVANDQLHLPNKKLLENKLREITEIAEGLKDEDGSED